MGQSTLTSLSMRLTTITFILTAMAVVLVFLAEAKPSPMQARKPISNNKSDNKVSRGDQPEALAAKEEEGGEEESGEEEGGPVQSGSSFRSGNKACASKVCLPEGKSECQDFVDNGESFGTWCSIGDCAIGDCSSGAPCDPAC